MHDDSDVDELARRLRVSREVAAKLLAEDENDHDDELEDEVDLVGGLNPFEPDFTPNDPRELAQMFIRGSR